MEFNPNRLRIVHCNQLFENVDDIKKYVQAVQFVHPALYGEPMVFRYKSSEEDGMESPNIVLAIGSRGDKSGFDYDEKTGGHTNRVFFIDIAQIEKDIKAISGETELLKSEIERIGDVVKAVIDSCGLEAVYDEDGKLIDCKYTPDADDAIIANAETLFNADQIISQYLQDLEKRYYLIENDSKTIDLTVVHEDSGTTISGDVKFGTLDIAENIDEDGNVVYKKYISKVGTKVNNIIIEQEDGIFTNVDLEYLPETTTESGMLSLIVNGISKKDINLPKEEHVVKGEYVKETEQIVLTMNTEKTVEISVSELIDEWRVEGEKSETPIVLKKEHVLYTTNEHGDDGVWKDVLKADVRITETGVENILETADGGKTLYVKGTADNIAYLKRGAKITVQQGLDEAYSTISQRDENSITLKNDGLYSFVNVYYDAVNNVIHFDRSNPNGEIVKNAYELSSVQLVQNAYYKSSTNELIIQYLTADKQLKEISIPMSEVFNDFEVDNTNTNVTLTLARNEAASDRLSARVNIAESMDDNILKSSNNELFVKGTSDNIRYKKDLTVEQALDLLLGNDDEQGSIRNLINVETEARKEADAALSGAIATEIERARQAEEDLTAKLGNIDLTYNAKLDELIFKDENGIDNELKLNPASIIKSLKYDPEKQHVVLTYSMTDTFDKEYQVYCNLAAFYNPWKVDADEEIAAKKAVKLTKVYATSDDAVDDQARDFDVLYADVKISKAFDDNLLVNESEDHGDLYVSRSGITNIEKAVGLVSDEKYGEATYKPSEDATYIADKTTVKDAIDVLDANLTRVDDSLANEINRATEAENALRNDLNAEIERATEADNVLKEKLDATIKGSGLNEDGTYKFNQETTYLHDTTSLNDADLKLDAALTEEVKRAEDAEKSLLDQLVAEINRAEETEAKLADDLAEEIERANDADAELESKINDIDLTYSKEFDRLTFTNGDNSKNIDLSRGSVIDSLEYDEKHKVTLTYHTTASADAPQTLEIDLSDLLISVDRETSNNGCIDFQKNGTELSAQVKITEAHEDNILTNDNGYLYVSTEAIYKAISEAYSGSIESAITSVEAERERAMAAERELDTKINNEVIRATSAETEIRQDLTNLSTTISAQMDTFRTDVRELVKTEETRAVSAETALQVKIETVSGDLTNAMDSLETSLEAEMSVLTSNVSGMVETERVRALSAETHIYSSLTKDIEDAVAELTIVPTDTDTVDMTKDENNLRADVIISKEADNIITRNNGIYASITFSYDDATNAITFTSSNGGTKTWKLATVSAVDKIYFDGETDELVFEFTTSSTDKPVQTRIPAASFFKGIIGSDNSQEHNIKVTTALTQTNLQDKTSVTTAITAHLDVDDIISPIPATVILKVDDNNKLTANVHIASNVPHNILQVDNVDEPNSLFVLGTSKNIYLDTPMRDMSGTPICQEEGEEDCIDNVDEAIQYLLKEIIKIHRFVHQAVVDSPSVDLTYTTDDNGSTLKADVILSNDCHNLLTIKDDGLKHPTDNNGHLIGDITSYTYDEDGNAHPVYGNTVSDNGLFFDGSIDYGTFDKICKRFLQLKRNGETFESKKEVLAYFNNKEFLADKQDGEPIIATYNGTDNNGNKITNIIFGIVRSIPRITTDEYGNETTTYDKYVYTFDNVGTVIDKFEYVRDAKTITATDDMGNAITTEVPAESLYFEYTDGSSLKRSFVVDMTDLIEEFTYPQAVATFDGKVAKADGVDNTKASDAEWGSTYTETDARTYHNVQFDIERKKDGKTIVKADVDFFDCGEY